MTQHEPNRLLPPPRNASFSAVLMAGGKSSRMGREKAALTIAGEPLWQRQWATLRRLQATETYVVGRPGGPYGDGSVEVVLDRVADCGPLRGLEAALERARTPWVCVLAIDLPEMTAEFLNRLLDRSMERGTGAIPGFDGRLEPMAAVYPKSLRPLVTAHLDVGDFALKRLIERGQAEGHLDLVTVEEADRLLFTNINSPEDWARWSGEKGQFF